MSGRQEEGAKNLFIDPIVKNESASLLLPQGPVGSKEIKAVSGAALICAALQTPLLPSHFHRVRAV